MEFENTPGVTQILDDLRRGDAGARERLLELVYNELRRMARVRMQKERPGQSLQATDLVHDMYMKMFKDEASWENRQHFFGTAAQAMRQILCDRARRMKAGKRDHDEATLHDQIGGNELSVDVLALDEALDRLALEHERKAEVVKYRYFLGMNIDDTAQLLGVARRTVDKDWKFAKCWLRKELGPLA